MSSNAELLGTLVSTDWLETDIPGNLKIGRLFRLFSGGPQLASTPFLRVSRHAPRFCSPFLYMDDLFIPPPNWIIGIEEIWEIKFQTKQLHSTISCRFILNFKNETSVSDEVSSYSQYPSKVHVANMGPTWVLSAPGGPHVGPMNLAISVDYENGNYDDVIMGAIASQITSLTSVYSTVYSDADHRKHQSSASLAFVWGIHREPVSSPHKWPVTQWMPFHIWWTS